MIKNHILYNASNDWQMKVSKAEDCYLWDEKKRKIIDFSAGWNVVNLGWNHPEINQAVIEQVNKNTYNPGWTSDEAQEKYAKQLLAVLPKEFNVIVKATGGTEANEQAMKIARTATGRKKIIGFKDTYHGDSFATMSLGYRPQYVKQIAPLVPDFIQIDYPSIAYQQEDEKKILASFLTKLEIILKKRDVAALVTEAGIITGWGSTLVAPYSYLKEIRRLTKNYGTLLILDEVGTGFSRCGKLFGMELENTVPDIVTFAKGMSNGAAAIGVAVTSSDLVQSTIKKTNIYSTFGWTSIACAASLKTLEIHLRERIWEKVDEKGNYIKSALTTSLSQHQYFGEVRGKGLEIGLEFISNQKTKKKHVSFTKKVINKALINGLLLAGSPDDGVIQIMPPLIIEKKVLVRGLEILIDVINSI